MIVTAIPPTKVTLDKIKHGECCLIDKIDFYMKISMFSAGFQVDDNCCPLVALQNGTVVTFKKNTMVEPFIGSVQLR